MLPFVAFHESPRMIINNEIVIHLFFMFYFHTAIPHFMLAWRAKKRKEL
jgi:hypothetical protein